MEKHVPSARAQDPETLAAVTEAEAIFAEERAHASAAGLDASKRNESRLAVGSLSKRFIRLLHRWFFSLGAGAAAYDRRADLSVPESRLGLDSTSNWLVDDWLRGLWG